MKIRTKTKSGFTPQPEPPGMPIPDINFSNLFKGLSH